MRRLRLMIIIIHFASCAILPGSRYAPPGGLRHPSAACFTAVRLAQFILLAETCREYHREYSWRGSQRTERPCSATLFRLLVVLLG